VAGVAWEPKPRFRIAPGFSAHPGALVVWRSACRHSAALFGEGFSPKGFKLGAPVIHGLQAPDGIPLRACVWPLPEGVSRRGVCVLLNGLTEFIEKYQEVADELGTRGFVVVSLDWRGQGASERLAQGNRRVHVGNFDAYDLDLTTLMRDVVRPLEAEGGPLIALAHSMGAHILLRHLHDNRRRFACAVMIAPMLDIDTRPYPPWTTRVITAFFNLRRPSKRFVFGVSDRDPLTLPFEKNMVTGDRGRYERAQAILRARPYLRVFGPTFGWLGAAFRSIRRVKRRGFPEDIATPLLIVGAGADRVVHTPAERAYAERLVKARYVEIADSEHEILMERDAVRARFWAEFDAFVAQYASAIPR
jgi:lysophospholipase